MAVRAGARLEYEHRVVRQIDVIEQATAPLEAHERHVESPAIEAADQLDGDAFQAAAVKIIYDGADADATHLPSTPRAVGGGYT
jgi:hypothetical protein